MRWSDDEVNPQPKSRVHRRFAFTPTRIGKQWVWLEPYWSRDFWFKNSLGMWCNDPDKFLQEEIVY